MPGVGALMYATTLVLTAGLWSDVWVWSSERSLLPAPSAVDPGPASSRPDGVRQEGGTSTRAPRRGAHAGLQETRASRTACCGTDSGRNRIARQDADRRPSPEAPRALRSWEPSAGGLRSGPGRKVQGPRGAQPRTNLSGGQTQPQPLETADTGARQGWAPRRHRCPSPRPSSSPAARPGSLASADLHEEGVHRPRPGSGDSARGRTCRSRGVLLSTRDKR